jgi:hypothetical protein
MKNTRLNNTGQIDDFVTLRFRDSADQDYVSARAAYRNEFSEQFRSCALNAVHKYLLAILLYNGHSTKHLGAQEVVKALESVRAMDDLGFDVPPDVVLFIQFLNRYGSDRFLRHPDAIPLAALLMLDKCVWSVRRFCVPAQHDPQKLKLLPRVRAKLLVERMQRAPHKVRIADGFLERIMDENLPSYRDLTWKNAYFGKNRKPEGRRPRFRITAMTPVQSLTPEAYEELSELLELPRCVAGRPAR